MAMMLVFGLGACADLPASSHSNIAAAPASLLDTARKNETPLPGLFQVEQDHAIAYVSADGRYEFDGDLIDRQTQHNLTEDARRADRLKAVSASDAITFSPVGPLDIDHVVTVFVDIDCSYCRRLHSRMTDYTGRGIAVRYLAWPRSGPGTVSWKKAEAVWCAKDRTAALTDAMRGQAVSPASCANAVAAEYELGAELGVHGTPTMVLPDGSLSAGYLPPEQLAARLAALSSVAH
jgi:thiol:disulfide interchange protein DsbC